MAYHWVKATTRTQAAKDFLEQLGFLGFFWDLPCKNWVFCVKFGTSHTKWHIIRRPSQMLKQNGQVSLTQPSYLTRTLPSSITLTHPVPHRFLFASQKPQDPVRLYTHIGYTGEQDPGVFVHGLYYCVLYWAKHSGLNLVFTNDSWHPPNLSTSLHSMSGLKCTRSPMVSSES